MVKLADAGSHLSGTRARGGDDDELTGGLDVIVFAQALIGDDVVDIEGVVGNGVVVIGADALFLKDLLEGLRTFLIGETGEADRADIEACFAEGINKAEDVLIIGDAEVFPHLRFLDGLRVDDDDDLRFLLHLQKKLKLRVRPKARENPACVIVVEKLASEFKV